MNTRNAAVMIGVVFLVVELPGFVSNSISDEPEYAIFHVDDVHNKVSSLAEFCFYCQPSRILVSQQSCLLLFSQFISCVAFSGFISHLRFLHMVALNRRMNLFDVPVIDH